MAEASISILAKRRQRRRIERVGGGQPAEGAAGVPVAGPVRSPGGGHDLLVAPLVRTAVVRLPSWFTVGQARRVAQLKAVEHVLVEDHGRLCGLAALADLRGAPDVDLLARWTTRTDATLDARASVAAAEAELRRAGVTCLPVVAGGMLVGTFSLADLPTLAHPAAADARITSHAA